MHVCVYVYVFMCGARIYTYIWSTPRNQLGTARAGSAHESRQVTHIHAHARAQTHTHIYKCMCKYTYNIIYQEHSAAQTWHSTRKKRTQITSSHTHTRVHTHTYTHIYICIYIYICVCTYKYVIPGAHHGANLAQHVQEARTNHIKSHTRARARAHTHTHIYIYRHTYMY